MEIIEKIFLTTGAIMFVFYCVIGLLMFGHYQLQNRINRYYLEIAKIDYVLATRKKHKGKKR